MIYIIDFEMSKAKNDVKTGKLVIFGYVNRNTPITINCDFVEEGLKGEIFGKSKIGIVILSKVTRSKSNNDRLLCWNVSEQNITYYLKSNVEVSK